MESLIKLLPESLANQIAAGEVVQRPASVVKELLENSIDAKAKHIQLIVEQAGKSSIQVIDDGMGMSVVDARMSFERHATSKIAQLEDLFQIRSLGFRGEALASIAAVAHVTLKTRRILDALGTTIKIEGGVLKSQNQCNCPIGTSINVEHLFFNVPARRNFLKSNAVEFKHILDHFLRVSLACESIGWDLVHNQNKLYALEAQPMKDRITAIYPELSNELLAEVNYTDEEITVQGFIGLPSVASKDKSEQYLFVNRRYVKSAYIHHAVMQAYGQSLQTGKQPIYFIYIEVAPQTIDINIHPTKTEIKFEQEQIVYQTVLRAVRNTIFGSTISTHNRAETNNNSNINLPIDPNFDDLLGPPIAQDINDINLDESTPKPSALDSLASYTGIHIKDRKSNTSSSNDAIRTRLKRAWHDLTSDTDIDAPIFPDQLTNPTKQAAKTNFTHHSPSNPVQALFQHPIKPDLGDVQVLGQMPSGFVVLIRGDELMILDPEAVQMVILQHQFNSILSQPQGLTQTQRLLFPMQWNYGQSNQVEVTAFLAALRPLGFIVDSANNELTFTALPAMFHLTEDEVISFLQQAWNSCAQVEPSQYASCLQLQIMNIVSPIDSRQLTNNELVAQWNQFGQPQFTTEGTPIVLTISEKDIARWMLKKPN
jgi:DNA mismatch repair protein MutL